jgi:hypothetical protein
MNLDNLKPAWQHFRLLNSMQRCDQQEILSIIERAEGVTITTTHRSVMITIVFIVLTLCCQGG